MLATRTRRRGGGWASVAGRGIEPPCAHLAGETIESHGDGRAGVGKARACWASGVTSGGPQALQENRHHGASARVRIEESTGIGDLLSHSTVQGERLGSNAGDRRGERQVGQTAATLEGETANRRDSVGTTTEVSLVQSAKVQLGTDGSEPGRVTSARRVQRLKRSVPRHPLDGPPGST